MSVRGIQGSGLALLAIALGTLIAVAAERLIGMGAL